MNTTAYAYAHKGDFIFIEEYKGLKFNMLSVNFSVLCKLICNVSKNKMDWRGHECDKQLWQMLIMESK